MNQSNQAILNRIKGGLVVSCQALKEEPLYSSYIMSRMAYAAMLGGAVGIRANTIADITEIKKTVSLPIIGIIKEVYGDCDVYITPTMKEVDDLVAAGSDVVALDCTLRKRGDGITVNEFIAQIKEKYPDIILMADISNYEEGINAWKCGVDIVGTTMSGYTDYTSKKDEPDYELMERLAKDTDIPIIGEGKIHYPDQAVKALQTGVWAIVVGGAITRPLEIAQRFQKAIENSK